ncbi:MAG: response regulator transcription factor [Pseudonocardiaceae bacterium]
MNLAGVSEAVGALRQARQGEESVLLAPEVAEALRRVLPADEITFNDLDLRACYSTVLGLVPCGAEERHGAFWLHFWDTQTCTYTERVPRLRDEVMMTSDFYSVRQWHSTGMYTDCLGPDGIENSLIMPLPSLPGIARRLVFFRGPGRSFGEAERATAVVLQPHIADALRTQSRYAAARLLTARQRQLLALVAAGHDNITIARQLGLSPATVRTHLENTFARLGVSSRTEAVAKTCPDATWR